MSLLDSIHSGRTNRPPRIMIYSAEGMGKSTWASQAPHPIFIDVEGGLDEINCDKFPQAKSFTDVITQLTAVRDEEHNYQSVVIDSLDWCERLIFDDVCKEYGVKSIEKADGGYGKGYVIALAYWRKIIALLNQIREKRNMLVILIAHAKIERFEDPENPAYDRYSPRLNKHASSLVAEWVDALFFAALRMRVSKDNDRTVAAAIGASGGDRVLRTIGSPACMAKNRYSLPPELPLDWDAFMNALTKPQEA